MIPRELESEQKALAIQEKENLDVFQQLKDLVVESEEDFLYATDILRELKRQNKSLEERKQRVTKPLMGVVEEVRSWFRPAQQWLTQAEVLLKKRLAEYRQKVDAQNLEAMRLLAETKGAADVKFSPTPKAEGLTMSEAWDWEIVDLDLVPRDFLAVDPAKVKAYLKTTPKGGVPGEVPGLKFVSQVRLAIRT